jgi:hypothetical protein
MDKMGKVNYVYIGPNIPQVGLKRNTIYRDSTLPDALAKYAVLKPAVKSLFVPTTHLAVAEKNKAKQGSLEFLANKELLAYAKIAKPET